MVAPVERIVVPVLLTVEARGVDNARTGVSRFLSYAAQVRPVVAGAAVVGWDVQDGITVIGPPEVFGEDDFPGDARLG